MPIYAVFSDFKIWHTRKGAEDALANFVGESEMIKIVSRVLILLAALLAATQPITASADEDAEITILVRAGQLLTARERTGRA